MLPAMPTPLRVIVAPAIVSFVLAGCGGGSAATTPEDFHFPPQFLFGSAIAGFQVEMGCPTTKAAECDDPASDWYAFITKPELVADQGLYIHGDPPSTGPGFFELYPADLDRAARELHGNALRQSIEWSRIFPTSTDAIEGYDALKKAASPAALAYYHALFAAMKARGLKPLVTLNHYSLPLWIHDVAACHADINACKDKGWADRPRIVKEIAKYAGFVGREFGGEVDLWATLNEPFTAVVVAGFLFPTAQRSNPPGVFLKTDAAKTAMTAMIEGHARMYDAVHAGDTVDADGDGKAARVGIVYNLQAVSPDDPEDPVDQQGVKNLSYVMNEMFLNGVARGDLDANIDGNVVHRDDLANRLDFLGINYYQRTIVQGTPQSFFPAVSPLLTFNLINLALDADPKGLYEVIRFGQRYNVPMMITETGVDDGKDDGSAPAWVVRTLGWVKRAIADGAPVEGYFYWSLIDNYEWNHGMTWYMGLYGIDSRDPMKTRRPRKAVAAYSRIAQAGAIPDDLLEQYKLPPR